MHHSVGLYIVREKERHYARYLAEEHYIGNLPGSHAVQVDEVVYTDKMRAINLLVILAKDAVAVNRT